MSDQEPIKGTNSAEDYGSTDNNADKPTDTTDKPTYTVQEALNHAGVGPGTILPIFCALISQFTEGAEYTVLGTIIPKLKCEWSLSQLQVAIIPFTIIISAISGGVAGGHIITRFGRLYNIVIFTFLSSIAAIASAMAGSFVQFLIFRGITVLFLEIATSAITIYSVEYSPVWTRPYIFTAQSISYGIGALTAALTARALLESSGWRVVLVILSVPGFIGALATLTQRESAFYDIACDRLDSAKTTITNIWRLNKTAPLEGELVKHNVGDPTEKSEDVEGYRDTTFQRHTVAFIFVSISQYLTWSLLMFGGPRMYNEGYCGTELGSGNHTANCHTYSDKSLSMLALGMAGEIAGAGIMLAVNMYVSRIVSIRTIVGALAVLLFALLICIGGSIKLVINIVLLKFVKSCSFTIFKLYSNEVYPTDQRAMLQGYLLSTGRLFSISTAVAALLLSLDNYPYLIGGIGGVSSVAFVMTFLFQKETRTSILE
eukprot:sb/3464204/